MIDPDGIQIQESNLPSIIKITNDIGPCCIESYCLEDEKEFSAFVKDVERNVRRSMEYRKFISYLRENMQMNQDAFLEGISNQETFDIRIEIHHYPFSLHDIVEAVIRKRTYYNESLTMQMVSKEVMELHYKMIVGLIPLSETVHELAHSGRIFIPVDKVIGRYNLFVQYYQPFIDPDQLEALDRIEKYTREQHNRVLNTNILAENKVTYDIKDTNFMLPDTSKVNTAMIEQLKNIKANNYMLPSVDQVPMIEEKKVRQVVSFDPGLKNITGKYSWEY